jgi:transposase-like protein
MAVNNENQHEVGDYRSRRRWSAGKKMDAVLRLLRGESLEELSRELQVEAHRLAAWRDNFLEGGQGRRQGPAGRPVARWSRPAAGWAQDRPADHGERDPAGRGRKEGLSMRPAKRPRAMDQQLPVAVVCRVLDAPRSTVYARRHARQRARPGPATSISDTDCSS